VGRLYGKVLSPAAPSQHTSVLSDYKHVPKAFNLTVCSTLHNEIPKITANKQAADDYSHTANSKKKTVAGDDEASVSASSIPAILTTSQEEVHMLWNSIPDASFSLASPSSQAALRDKVLPNEPRFREMAKGR